MGADPLYGSNALGGGQHRKPDVERKPPSKRQQAADAFNIARKLAREALEEENAEAEAKRIEEAMVAEYGPRSDAEGR